MLGLFIARIVYIIQGTKSPSSASQAILCIFWNLKVHCQMHESPLLVPVLRFINRVCAHSSVSWRSILILSHDLRLGHPSGLCNLGFPPRTVHLFSPLYMPHAQPVSLISNPSSISFQARYILYIAVLDNFWTYF